MSTIEEGVTHNMQNVQQTPQPGSAGTTGVQNTQNNHNTQNITINNNRPQSYPDETGYTMPPDTGAPVNGTWVYGSPDLSYDGKSPSNGVSVYTMDGSTPPSSPDSVPMPIPGMNGETHMGTGGQRDSLSGIPSEPAGPECGLFYRRQLPHRYPADRHLAGNPT